MVPVLQALVLAERIWVDKSGQKIIGGTFNKITMQRKSAPREFTTPDGTKKQLVPGGGAPLAPSAFISLTDVCNNTELTLQFVRLDQNIVLLETLIQVACSDRLQTVEVVAKLPVLPINEPGVYAFEVVCENEIIGSHRLIAEAEEEKPNQ